MAEAAPGYDQAFRYAQELRELYQRERARSEELKETVEALRKTDEQRRRLLAQLVNAQEEERKRIAGDIHDDSIQIMTAVVMRLDMMREELTNPRHRDDLARLEEAARLSIARLRNLMFELRPSVLDREGLLAGLRSYLANVETDFGPAYRLSSTLSKEPPPDLRLLLYRLAQEALTNARKHSRAAVVDVNVSESDGGIRLAVTDDGRGFRLADARDADPRHLGMASMHERAELAGGWCRVVSEPGAGTTVEFWIPADDGS